MEIPEPIETNENSDYTQDCHQRDKHIHVIIDKFWPTKDLLTDW